MNSNTSILVQKFEVQMIFSQQILKAKKFDVLISTALQNFYIHKTFVIILI